MKLKWKIATNKKTIDGNYFETIGMSPRQKAVDWKYGTEDVISKAHYLRVYFKFQNKSSRLTYIYDQKQHTWTFGPASNRVCIMRPGCSRPSTVQNRGLKHHSFICEYNAYVQLCLQDKFKTPEAYFCLVIHY